MTGHEGWDAYAPYYDWENARTMGRRDVRFWTGVAQRIGGRVLELGSGTGRLTVPLARAGVSIVYPGWFSLSMPMAATRAARWPTDQS